MFEQDPRELQVLGEFLSLHYCFLYFLLFVYLQQGSYTIRNKFQKLGKDIEVAKGRDMDRYHSLLGHLKDSYHRCGMVCFYIVFLGHFC